MKFATAVLTVAFMAACATVPVAKPGRPPAKYGSYHLVAYASVGSPNGAVEFAVLFVGIGAKYVSVYYQPGTDSWYGIEKFTNFDKARADYLGRVRRGVEAP